MTRFYNFWPLLGASIISSSRCLELQESFPNREQDYAVLLQHQIKFSDTSTDSETASPLRLAKLPEEELAEMSTSGADARMGVSWMQRAAAAGNKSTGSSCYEEVTSGLPPDQILSLEQLRRGVVNMDGAFRFRSLLKKLESGSSDEAVRVLIIGGSVDKLEDFVNPYTGERVSAALRWVHLVSGWLSSMSQNKLKTELAFFSGADHAITLSSPSSFTLDAEWNQTLNSVPQYDLVFVQGSVNSFERTKPGFSGWSFSKDVPARRKLDEMITRAVLDHANGPAVMFVNWFYSKKLWAESQDRYLQGSQAEPVAYTETVPLEHRFSSWEDTSYNFLSLYYEVSMVSGRSAMLHSTEAESASDYSIGPRFKTEDIWSDGLHPTALGNTLLSQVVEYGLCEQFHRIKESPLDQKTASSLTTLSSNLSVPDGVKLPPAVFDNAAGQLALRREADLAGFSNVDEVITVTSPPVESAVVPGNTSGNASGNASVVSMLPSEMQVTILPLIFLELCAAAISDRDVEPRISAPNPNVHTLALDPFRFLGIFHIVLMHELGVRKEDDAWWAHIATYGKYWVQFFFALSGLVLYISQGGRPCVSDPQSFVAKRIYGTYPPYLVGTVLALLAAEKPASALCDYWKQNAMPGFMLLDTWAYPYGTASPDLPAWFVCTLLAFWFCFPHWYRFVHELQYIKLATLCSYLSTFGLPLLYAAQFGSEKPEWGPFAEFHPFSNWQTFFFGMCLGRMIQETSIEALPPFLCKAASSFALVVLLCLPLFTPSPDNTLLVLFFDKGPLLLPIFGTFLYFLPFGEDVLLRPTLLQSALPKYLGAMSGHLFLFHWPVRLLVARFADGDAPLALTLALQLLVSTVFYELQKTLIGPLRSRK